jgi:hypothetical protein
VSDDQKPKSIGPDRGTVCVLYPNIDCTMGPGVIVTPLEYPGQGAGLPDFKRVKCVMADPVPQKPAPAPQKPKESQKPEKPKESPKPQKPEKPKESAKPQKPEKPKESPKPQKPKKPKESPPPAPESPFPGQ